MTEYLNIIPKHTCTGCGACSAICPKHCIALTEDSFGFPTPMVDLDTCIHCNLCEKACPVLNSDNDSKNALTPIKIYASRNQNNDVSKKSSSGGIFSVFAEYVLNNGGAVYGVSLNPELSAEHIKIESTEELYRIQGSKYLQSYAAKSYPHVKNDLTAGKTVLFSGTPCQIAALRQFLLKSYSNLICIEVVCHGVPSNKVFREYVKGLERKYKSTVLTVNFRDKSHGWHDNSIMFKFRNGRTFGQRGKDNLYSLGYVNNLFVRDSCTDCKFKAFKSGSDITLGDMWGIESIDPSYDIANGVSMVSINSPAGESLFNKIKNQITETIEVTYQMVQQHNSCICQSVKEHPKRYSLLRNLNQVPIDQLIKEGLSITSLDILKKSFQTFKAQCVTLLVLIKHVLFRQH